MGRCRTGRSSSKDAEQVHRSVHAHGKTDKQGSQGPIGRGVGSTLGAIQARGAGSVWRYSARRLDVGRAAKPAGQLDPRVHLDGEPISHACDVVDSALNTGIVFGQVALDRKVPEQLL